MACNRMHASYYGHPCTLCLPAGIYIGCCASLISVYEQVLVKAGYNEYQEDIGFVGLGIQCLSVLGAVAMGRCSLNQMR